MSEEDEKYRERYFLLEKCLESLEEICEGEMSSILKDKYAPYIQELKDHVISLHPPYEIFDNNLGESIKKINKVIDKVGILANKIQELNETRREKVGIYGPSPSTQRSMLVKIQEMLKDARVAFNKLSPPTEQEQELAPGGVKKRRQTKNKKRARRRVSKTYKRKTR